MRLIGDNNSTFFRQCREFENTLSENRVMADARRGGEMIIFHYLVSYQNFKDCVKATCDIS